MNENSLQVHQHACKGCVSVVSRCRALCRHPGLPSGLVELGWAWATGLLAWDANVEYCSACMDATEEGGWGGHGSQGNAKAACVGKAGGKAGGHLPSHLPASPGAPTRPHRWCCCVAAQAQGKAERVRLACCIQAAACCSASAAAASPARGAGALAAVSSMLLRPGEQGGREGAGLGAGQ